MEFIRQKKPALSIDMAPLIDIVFQLLVFFMLSSSFLNPALRLNLPKAAEHDRREPEHVVVSLDADGNVFVNTIKTSMNELRMLLENEIANNPKKSVHIRGDQEMAYKYFVEVMDISRQAGARQINIVHQAVRKE
ncbi:MAG: ExbD/TolR family protein [Candidatus Loosdrechtia sp.]|uniref:ExbD/TolR family protein n=1 Tax=Candidatus Loosdrechtia sp. TaxID=3101272 RepID=UPI003A6D9085|nr:MAG: biopolymer transporter ExbD [Candidatus Jettenia sp. AMX2]